MYDPDTQTGNVDVAVISQLMAAQAVLYTLPTKARIGEFIARVLEHMPGIQNCVVCIYGQHQPFGRLPVECRKLCRGPEANQDEPVPYVCISDKSKPMTTFPLATGQLRFGQIVIETDNSELFETHRPFISNFANLTTLVIENKWQERLLKSSNEELVKHKSILEEQVEARTSELLTANRHLNASNQQLIASQQELKVKNEELQSIVHISSHDLKTPLVNINGFSEMLIEHCDEMKQLVKKCDADTDTKKEITSLLNDGIPTDLEYISTSTKRMERLIAGLLQVSRIGTVEIKTQNINMEDIVAEIIDNVKYKTQDLDAEVVFENLPDCTGDKDQIIQVFTNLIGNALKYLSPKRKGRIKITGNIENKESIYCIEDNGIGINLAYHGKVFEIYHRLNPQTSTEGDGLGLTIVRRILDHHKGRIWLESEPDKGSKFFIAIPTK